MMLLLRLQISDIVHLTTPQAHHRHLDVRVCSSICSATVTFSRGDRRGPHVARGVLHSALQLQSSSRSTAGSQRRGQCTSAAFDDDPASQERAQGITAATSV